MFDNYAYLDPAKFPLVVRDPHPKWRTIVGYNPDFLVICGAIYQSEPWKSLIETQSLDEDEPYIYSVRVYQDLLKTNEPGPTDRQGVEYVER